jgi:hypothetical protein
MQFKSRLAAATKAALVHLLCSLGIALLAGMLVFLVWYPYPFRELSGGRELFLLIMGVDVVCGPLLTMVLYNPRKPKAELVRDLGMVAIIQLAALGYGLFTVAMARPVYVVHEVDRLRVVSRADIPEGQLKPELGGFHQLSWFGPKFIGVREPKDGDERLKSLDLALQGQEPSVRPDWWQSYELSSAKVLARAKSLAELRKKRPESLSKIDRAVVESGKSEADMVWLPMTSFKNTDWVVLMDAKTAAPLAYAHIDGF